MYNSRAVIYYTAGVVTALTLFTLRRLIYPNETSAAGPKKLKAVFFGDSITQHGFNPEISGWLCHMANWWTRRVDVVNRGFSGYNSRWGVLIVDKVVVPENPDIVFVFFGANDAVDERVGQHVALPEYGDNIRAIIKAIRNSLPKARLVLITPPPIWEPTLEEMNLGKGKLPTLDRTNERTLQYAESCKAIGQQLSIPVVDAWTAMEGNTPSRGSYLSDGLHLNVKGNTALFEEVRKVVLRAFPDLAPEALPMHMLEWAQMIERDRQLGLGSGRK